MEVYHLTGQPISHQQQEFENQTSTNKQFVFQLCWPREVLHSRIEARVQEMFDGGLVAEVESLLSAQQALGRTALQAVGYREVVDYLEGKRDLAETMEQVVYHTRRFARRQETWFRGFPECKQIEMAEELTTDQVVDQILSLVETG